MEFSGGAAIVDFGLEDLERAKVVFRDHPEIHSRLQLLHGRRVQRAIGFEILPEPPVEGALCTRIVLYRL